MFADFIPVLFTERRRGLPDFLAGTVVVLMMPGPRPRSDDGHREVVLSAYAVHPGEPLTPGLTPPDRHARIPRVPGFFHRFARAHHESKPDAAAADDGPTVIQLDATAIWRPVSRPAWFLVGVAILMVGLTSLLALTSEITLPVALGAILTIASRAGGDAIGQNTAE